MADAPDVIVAGQPFVMVVEPAAAPALVIATGPQGPPGRDGAPGGTTFSWHQETPTEVWTVPHNLQRRPSVTVTDDGGNSVLSDVQYIDDNIIQITHGRPSTGWAYFN